MLDDATGGAFQAGWTKPVGGDADHLEQLEDIDDTVAAGFVFYTLDPKAEVDPRPNMPTLRRSSRRWRHSTGPVWRLTWRRSPRRTPATRVDLEHEAIELDEASVLRAMAKYGPSLAHSMAMYRQLMEKGIDCEVEFAVDETDYPTTPAEHSWWSAN